jgi:hypothetical protein
MSALPIYIIALLTCVGLIALIISLVVNRRRNQETSPTPESNDIALPKEGNCQTQESTLQVNDIKQENQVPDQENITATKSDENVSPDVQYGIQTKVLRNEKLRLSAEIDSNTCCEAYPGDDLLILYEDGIFYKVQQLAGTDRGKTGYILKDAVSYDNSGVANGSDSKLERSFTAGVKKSSPVRACIDETIFSEPNIFSSKVGDIHVDDEAIVYKELQDYFFINLVTGVNNGLSGYVFKSVFDNNNISENKESDLTPQKSEPGLTDFRPALFDCLLFERPSFQSNAIREIKKSEPLIVKGRQGEFYEVLFNVGFDSFLPGFVETTVIETKQTQYKQAQYKIRRAIVSLKGNVYTEPQRTSPVLSQLKEGDKIIILKEVSEFYEIKTEGTNIKGYIEKDLLSSKMAIIIHNGIMNLKPDINSEAICEVFKDDKVLVLEELDKYYRIKLSSEYEISGYVSKELVNSPETKNTKIIESEILQPQTNVNADITETHYPILNSTTPPSPVKQEEVIRPGLTSFAGYYWAVVGWIDVIASIIFLMVLLFANSEISRWLASSRIDAVIRFLFIYGWAVGIGCLFLGIIFIATGRGVLRGSGSARVFATIWSLFLIPSIWGIIFFILIMIGLFNGEANEYFRYRRDNPN